MQILHNHEHFANVHPAERWISVFAGAALLAGGLRRGTAGLLPAAAGTLMIRRGFTGRCELYRLLGVRTNPSNAALPYELGIRAGASVTINHARDKVFQFWRQFENLPRFMRHLISVESDGKHSHWVAEGPAGRKVQWDAEILREIENELISWRSLPGGDVASAGSVRFSDAPGGRGTEIHVELQYNPPGGIAGAYLARLFGREPEQEIKADLARLKQFLETGEVATTKGQPKGPPYRQRTDGKEEAAAGHWNLPSVDEVLP